MDTPNIKEHRERKERGHSVREVLEEAIKSADRYDAVVVAALDVDGEILVSYSTDNTATLIGVLEVTKLDLVEQIREQS